MIFYFLKKIFNLKIYYISYTSFNMSNNNEYSIFNFLNENLVQDGQSHTHTSMHNPKQKYFIKDLDKFYELYEKALFNGTELHLTERREDISGGV